MLAVLLCFCVSLRRGMEVIKSPAKAELAQKNANERVIIRLNGEEDEMEKRKFHGAVMHGIRQDTSDSNIYIRLNEENKDTNAEGRIIIRLNEENKDTNAEGRILIRLNEENKDTNADRRIIIRLNEENKNTVSKNSDRVAAVKRPGQTVPDYEEEGEGETIPGADLLLPGKYPDYTRPEHTRPRPEYWANDDDYDEEDPELIQDK